MARNVAILFLVFIYGSCMEMRETVERTVMVRTTGSDLQPAATGYIYKKESDGPVSVTKMGETEVMEHFSKLYGKSESYKAPTPVAAGPFHASEDEDKAASYANEELVKPVVEEDHGDDTLDGIAHEDYDKMFKEYAKRYGNYKNDFDDYLLGAGHYDHDIFHGFENDKDFGSKGYRNHGDEGQGIQHKYEKGGAGNYQSEKHTGYSISKEGSQKHRHGDADAHGEDASHKVFDKDGYKKHYDLYDGDRIEGKYNKYADEHTNRGSINGGHKKEESHQSGSNDPGFGKSGNADKESRYEEEGGNSSEKDEHSGQQKYRDFGVKEKQYAGKSYGYNIKH